MHKEYRSYDILNAIDSNVLEKIQHEPDLGILNIPFDFTTSLDDTELVEFKDIIFYNTNELSPAANHYREFGVYTKLSPLYDKVEYTEFWDEEERRRKEGYDAPCSVVSTNKGYKLQSVHITGEHYGYLNYAPIKRISNEHLAAVGKLLREGIDPKDPQIQAIVDDKITDFPAFTDVDYYYFKSVELARSRGKHLVVAKARRKGYSYKNGWMAADKADLYPNSVTGLGAFHADSLYPGGTMTMCNNYLQHTARTTDWSKRRLIDKQDVIKFGYKRNDSLGIERGFLSSVFAASFAPNNPGALRGKDCKFMIIEESGKNPILDKVLTSTLPTLKAGVFVTGLMIVFGTGGGEDKQWEAFEDLFYYPSTEDFLAFNNIWDDDEIGTECGFFVPSFMGKEGFFDVHGNSDVKGAMKFELSEREKRKKSTKASKLSDYMMEEPFTPKEAFSRSKTNIFPSVEIEAQLRRVLKDPNIKALTRTGILSRNEKGKVVFKDQLFLEGAEKDKYHPPIFNFPIKKEDDPNGCIVIWEPPFRDRATGRVPDFLYRAEHDPFAVSKDNASFTTKDSLGVTYIYKTTNNLTPDMGDTIVASYIGRPPTTKEYNIEMFKLLEYYNAILQFENDRGDVFNHAREMRCLDWLADEPEILWQKDLQGKKTGRKKGISMNTARKEKGVIYLRDWLITPRGTDDFGNIKLNLHYIYDPALLKELLKFHFKGNFDRVSTRIVGMYDKRESVFNEVTKPYVHTGTSVFDREWF